jgi:hypothetical protein
MKVGYLKNMEKQKQIKFSEDYEKLPLLWKETTATLIAVYPEKVKRIKNRWTVFWNGFICFFNNCNFDSFNNMVNNKSK